MLRNLAIAGAIVLGVLYVMAFSVKMLACSTLLPAVACVLQAMAPW